MTSVSLRAGTMTATRGAESDRSSRPEFEVEICQKRPRKAIKPSHMRQESAPIQVAIISLRHSGVGEVVLRKTKCHDHVRQALRSYFAGFRQHLVKIPNGSVQVVALVQGGYYNADALHLRLWRQR